MRIEKILVAPVSTGSNMANAYINFKSMTSTFVAVVTDVIRNGKPVVGFGFNSIGRYACGGDLMDRMVAKLNAVPAEALVTDEGDNLAPFKINAILKANEKPGGHGDRAHAVGGIDMAVWDAVARIEEKPLYRLLSERYNKGQFDETIYTYGAGGYYYAEGSDEKLTNELKSYLDRGFRDVKIKIGGAGLKTDCHRIEVALSVLNNDGQRLMVDANGRFDLETALAYGKELDRFGVRWFEEPVDPLNYADLAVLAENYKGALATGENLFSFEDARNLVRHGGLRGDRDFMQLDCPLSYGLVEYLKILDYMKSRGWNQRQFIPHGGHLFCAHIAAGLQLGGNENYPGVFQPLGGFTDAIPVINSRVGLPDIPGIGFELKANLWQAISQAFPDLV